MIVITAEGANVPLSEAEQPGSVEDGVLCMSRSIRLLMRWKMRSGLSC